jgi:hypothetical protein
LIMSIAEKCMLVGELLNLFGKWGNYSRGDIIQGRIIIKEIRYLVA